MREVSYADCSMIEDLIREKYGSRQEEQQRRNMPMPTKGQGNGRNIRT